MHYRIFVFVFAFLFTSQENSGAQSRDHEALYTKGQAMLVQELAIGGGSDEGDEPPPFYTPIDMCIAGDGSIYVLDAETCEVIAFDPTGDFRFRVGGGGEGPGELREPRSMSIDRLGRVIVYENGNHRFSTFSASGKFLKTSSFYDVTTFRCLGDGRVVAHIAREQFVPGTMETHWSVVVLDSSLQVAASLDSLTTRRWIVVPTEEGFSTTTQPFYEELLWCVSPDGRFYVARSGDYKIKVYGDQPGNAKVIRRSVSAPKVTKKDRDEYLEGFSKWSPGSRREALSLVEFPSRKPQFDAFYCDSRGFFLAQRAQPPDEPPLFDVFRPDGTFLSSTTIPGFRYGTVFSSDGVFMRVFSRERLPAIIRYRME